MAHSNTHTTPLIIVGLSGGVDSSVSAYLLQQQGYRVEGLFMKNWQDDGDDTQCNSAQDLQDAQAVCDKLGITLHQINFAKTYWDRVFEYFLAEYRAGRTPNPDILCNRDIKFTAFLDYAKRLGADKIATGHYAQIINKNGQYQLHQGIDHNKDQSYFLYALNQQQLAASLFPLGELTKPSVRQLARKLGLANHAKKDSTGICFIGERKFNTFLGQYLPAQSGIIKTIDGKVIGKHHGLMYYTIGQRKGIGIGGQQQHNEQPWYVADKHLPSNTLIVAQGSQHPALFKSSLIANDCHWIAGIPPSLPLQCQAKIRYRQPTQSCTLLLLDKQSYQVTFDIAQRAVTPGQSIVFYINNQCLGGGIIQ